MKYSESKGKSHWFQGLFQFGNRVNNTEKEGVAYLVAKMPASCENHGNTYSNSYKKLMILRESNPIEQNRGGND